MEPDDDRAAHRPLLPEEEAAGSDDPQLQAETLLEESDQRTDDPKSTRHDSAQTPD